MPVDGRVVPVGTVKFQYLDIRGPSVTTLAIVSPTPIGLQVVAELMVDASIEIIEENQRQLVVLQIRIPCVRTGRRRAARNVRQLPWIQGKKLSSHWIEATRGNHVAGEWVAHPGAIGKLACGCRIVNGLTDAT